MFVPGQLRTLQRRVKDWRQLEARRLMLTEPLDRDANPNGAMDDLGQVDSKVLIASVGQEDGSEPAHAR